VSPWLPVLVTKSCVGSEADGGEGGEVGLDVGGGGVEVVLGTGVARTTGAKVGGIGVGVGDRSRLVQATRTGRSPTTVSTSVVRHPPTIEPTRSINATHLPARCDWFVVAGRARRIVPHVADEMSAQPHDRAATRV
jgi:hypothetical protein